MYYRNRNDGKYIHSNDDFCKKSSLQAMWWFSWESLYASNFSKAVGLSKDLYSKVYKTCGIKFLRTMRGRSVMQEWCYIRRQNGSVYSESSVCRQKAVRSKLRISCNAVRLTLADFASAVEATIKWYATRKLWCGWAGNKRGWQAYTTFTSCQNALCSSKFFCLCWVDYTLEGSIFSPRKCAFSRLFHTARSWHTYRFTVVSGR